MIDQLKLKKPQYATGKDLEELRKKIKDLANTIRERKNAGADNREILNLISDLLELKFLDESNQDCVAPKDLKLRWNVVDKDGKEVSLQRPVNHRTSLSAKEVLSIVEQYTIKKIGKQVGTIMKIEVIEKDEKTKEKSFRALNENDRLVTPLVFPGPIFKDLHIFKLRVTFSEPPSNLSFPKSFATLPVLPDLVDTGVNLTDSVFDTELDNHIHRAVAAGVSQMIVLCVDYESSKKAVKLAQTYENTVFAMVGVHPSQASHFPPTPENIALFKDLVKQRGVIGVGEIGLDHSYCEGGSRYRAPKDKKPATDDTSKASPSKEKKQTRVEKNQTAPTRDHQAAWFRALLSLASESELPVLLHERESHDEFVKLLKPLRSSLKKGVVVNCFTGGPKEFKTYTKDLNMSVCVTGIVANDDRSVELRAALKDANSLDNVVIGTDAPYLTPFASLGRPFPKFNVPQTLPHVAAYVAALYKGKSLPAVEKKDELAENEHLKDVEKLFVDGDKNGIAESVSKVTKNIRTAFALPTPLRSHTPREQGAASVAFQSNRYPQPSSHVEAKKDEKKAVVLPEGVTEDDVFLHGRKVSFNFIFKVD